jgi:hypothetical protein
VKDQGPRKSIVGRGAAGNPDNRFERIEVEPDEIEGDEPRPETVYLRDHSRSIIARNDSPDIGFDSSINPYRGCSHGCAYCLLGDTPILMANGTTRRLENIRVGDEIYGTVRRGAYRRYTKTRVLNYWSVKKPAYHVTLEDGTSLVCGGDHRFLTDRGWKFVTGAMQGRGQRPYLTTNNELMGPGAFSHPPSKDLITREVTCAGLFVEMGISPPTYMNVPGVFTETSIDSGSRSLTKKHFGLQRNTCWAMG